VGIMNEMKRSINSSEVTKKIKIFKGKGTYIYRGLKKKLEF
jgi:hypothetical protein